MYTIGQVAKQVNMPVSTLRYYDNEGLFPHLVRCSGIRKFSDNEIEALHIIECLKKSGLEIREIKKFMELCAQGSSGIYDRSGLAHAAFFVGNRDYNSHNFLQSDFTHTEIQFSFTLYYYYITVQKH